VTEEFRCKNNNQDVVDVCKDNGCCQLIFEGGFRLGKNPDDYVYRSKDDGDTGSFEDRRRVLPEKISIFGKYGKIDGCEYDEGDRVAPGDEFVQDRRG